MTKFFCQKKSIQFLSLIFMMSAAFTARADTSPPRHITSPEILAKVASHYLDYGDFKIIGECQWFEKKTGITVSTQELDEYLPDLIVSVYNAAGDNPWLEPATLIDPESDALGSSLMYAMTGYTMETGHTSSQQGTAHADSVVMKEVDVIGNPSTLFRVPFETLDVDTNPFELYYQSSQDFMADRVYSIESFNPKSFNMLDYYIGTANNHWGYEYPRSMTVNNSNDYKASVMIALHAVDIVTNNNSGHTVLSTLDSCGDNCAVANVIEEISNNHEKWQEVYPNDRLISLGESDALSTKTLGLDDTTAGNGNYVFVIWRHYRGCQQGPGELIFYTRKIPATEKR